MSIELGRHPQGQAKYEYQKIRLDCGLDRLKTLRAMRELRVSEGTGQSIEMREALWMIDSWPKLDTVDLTFAHRDPTIRAELIWCFTRHGVHVV